MVRTGSVVTNMARAVLYSSGLPKFLWAEALSTATHGIPQWSAGDSTQRKGAIRAYEVP